MIVIGLLLLMIAAAFGIDFIWKNDVHITNPTVFGERLGIHSAASLFVLGAITGAVALLGAALLLWGARRKGASAVSRRHERTETRRLREDRDNKVRADSEQAHSSENEEPDSKLNQSTTEAAPAVTTAPGAQPTENTVTDQIRDV